MNDSGAIELVGMEFHSNHGCYEQEIKEGNTFVVDFYGRLPIEKAARTDNLENTADCRKIYEIISREMERRSNLLEAVAGRIVDAIERETFGFYYVQVRVSKKNPPVGGVCAWSRVTACRGWRPYFNDPEHTF